MTEIPLPGNATAGVVRIGDTVRRPAGPWTGPVDAVLTHLWSSGFTGAPRPLGRDEQGRQVLEYVPGEVGDPAGTYSPADLTSIGRLLAALHEALAGFTPPPGAHWNQLIPPDREDLICHNDVAPWNLVRAARGWVLIDWDGTAPASRQWDLAYAAQSVAGLRPGRPVPEAAERLRAFITGYGPDSLDAPALADLLSRRSRAMYDLLHEGARHHREPWSRIFTEDGPYWLATTEYLTTHREAWAAALS